MNAKNIFCFILEKVIFEIKKKIIACKEQIGNLIVTLEIDDFKYKIESLNNIVNYNRGVVISKEYVEKNKGEYPVYSSNTLNDGIFGYINHYNYDCECLTWTTDGIYAGTIFVRSGKFSITNICGIMILKPLYDNQINLEFLKYNLDFKVIATGSDNKKVMTNTIINKNIQIKIPITATGEFDLQKQKEIAEKYRKIEEIKKSIKVELEKIDNIKVDIGL